MYERPLARRTIGAALLTLGLILAPVATSQGKHLDAPPGQVDKSVGPASGPAPSPPSGSPPTSAAAPPAASAPTGHVPPGQLKKQQRVAALAPLPSAPSQPTTTSATPLSTPAAPSGNTKLPPGQAKKDVGQVVSSTVTAAASAVTPAASAVTPAASAVTPAASAVTAALAPPVAPTASAPAQPTPTAATGNPATAGRPKHPVARRSSKQPRSSRRAGAGRRRKATTGRTSGGAARTARGQAVVNAAGTAAASVARHLPTRSRRPSTSSKVPPVGGAVHPVGPIQRLIGNLIPVPLPVPDWSKPIILALLLICALLGARAWATSRRARRLESQRRRLAADLESLQPALVPEIPPSFGPLAISVAYSPADGPAAGGDFYDVFPVGGGRVAIMVGDVSGHGRHALTRAAHMRYMLRAYLETGLDPRSALKLAGRVLGADVDALFTTVGVAVYDRSSSTMTYATAGHPPPIMLGPGAHEPLSIASPALGWGEHTGRRQTTIPFGEFARACFFSDGVTEVRVPDGLLGRTLLTRELDHSQSAGELLERVQRRATSIRDDMAACVVDARAGTPISDVRIEEFEVEGRHLDAGQGQRFLDECGVSAENASSTLAHARLIVTDSGSALLRVEMADGTAAASAGGSAPVSLAQPASVAPPPSRPWVAESPSIA